MRLILIVFLMFSTSLSMAEEACEMSPTAELVKSVIGDLDKLKETGEHLDRYKTLAQARDQVLDFYSKELAHLSVNWSFTSLLVTTPEQLEKIITDLSQLEAPKDWPEDKVRQSQSVQNTIQRMLTEKEFVQPCEAEMIVNLRRKHQFTDIALKKPVQYTKLNLRYAPASETWTLNGAYYLEIHTEAGEVLNIQINNLLAATPSFFSEDY